MGQKEFNRATFGLWSSNSSILAPEGALLEADNIVMRQVGKLEPARGYAVYKSTLSITDGLVDTMYEFDGRMYSVSLESPGAFDNSGLFRDAAVGSITPGYAGVASFQGTIASGQGPYQTALLNGASGSYTSAKASLPGFEIFVPSRNVYPTSTAKIGKSMYISGNQAPWRVDENSITGSPSQAGVFKGLHLSTSARSGDGTTSTPGWITSYTNKIETVAYRIVWGYTDANERLLLGAPSERFIHTTEQLPAISSLTRSGTTATCTTADVHGLTTGDVVTIDATESEWDGAFTITVSSTTVFTFTVTTSPATPATSPVWQITRDIDITFPVPTAYQSGASRFFQIFRTSRATYLINAAANDPGDEEALVGEFEFNSSGGTGYTYDSTFLEVNFTDTIDDALLGIRLYTNASQQGILEANDIAPPSAVMSEYKDHLFQGNQIQTAVFETRLITTAGWSSGTSTFKVDMGGGMTAVTFTAKTAENVGLKEFLLDTTSTLLSQKIENTMRSLVRLINTKTSTHGAYAEYISGFNDDPGIIRIIWIAYRLFVTIPAETTANFTVNSSTEGATFFPEFIGLGGTRISSTNFWRPNRISFSKFQQGDATPEKNFLTVGDESHEIFKMISFEDRLVILTNKGPFSLVGDTPSNFRLSGEDLTIQLLAPKTIVEGNNMIFMLAKQGIVTMSESGQIELISQAIDEEVLSYIERPHLRQCAHAIFDPIEHEYIIWFPTDVPDDTNALEDEWPKLNFTGFRYNVKTKTWTAIPKSVTAAFFNPQDGLIYYALTPTGAGPTYTTQHVISRRALDNTDYQDEDGNAITYRVVWAPFTGNDIMIGKQFTRAYIGLESDTGITAATVGFSNDEIFTEITQAFTTADPAFGLGNSHLLNVQMIVPQNMQRGRILNLSFQHAVKEEDWAILYSGIEYNTTSTRIQR